MASSNTDTSMVGTLRRAWDAPELRRRILFTLFIIVVFRLGSHIPVPGVDRVAFTQLISNFGQLGQMMDIISGGALTSVSIFSLGVQPYITSSIIIQLLTVAIPALERLSQEGETGRKKINKITRYTTVGLAAVMSLSFWLATRSALDNTLPLWVNGLLAVSTFTAGTMIVVWLGEQINRKGVGNGVSIIIFTGIVAQLPDMVQALWYQARSWDLNNNWGPIVATILVIVFLMAALALLVFVVYVQLAERRIPIQYSKRVVGRKQYGGQNSYLPIKVNQSGVMPVIFASAIAQLPSLMVAIFWPTTNNVVTNFFRDIGANPLYYVIMGLLIVLFTFFYSLISFNPIEISNNLQRNGGFIPGIRAGRSTSEYVQGIANKLNWFDAIFLILITLVPMIIGTITNTSAIWMGGTSIVIMVGVCTDLQNQLESEMSMKQYKGFLN